MCAVLLSLTLSQSTHTYILGNKGKRNDKDYVFVHQHCCLSLYTTIIFWALSFFLSSWHDIIQTIKWQSPYSTFLTHSMFICPLCWRPPPPGVIFYLLPTFFESLVPLKNMCATKCYPHSLAETFQVLVMEFSSTRSKISGLFISSCLFFVPQGS